MKKTVYLSCLFLLCAAVSFAQNTSGQQQKQSAAFLQAQAAAQQTNSATQARAFAAQGFDTSGSVSTTDTINPKKNTTMSGTQNASAAQKQTTQTRQTTTQTRTTTAQTQTSGQQVQRKRPLGSTVPLPTGNTAQQTTATQKTTPQQTQTTQKSAAATTQKQAATTVTQQTQTAQKKATATQKSTTTQKQAATTKRTTNNTGTTAKSATAPAPLNNGLPPVPKAKISTKQRSFDTTQLVTANSLKEPEKEDENEDSYARKRHVHLKDYKVIHEKPVTQEQVDRANARNLIRRVREENYVMTPEEEAFVDSVLQKIQDQQRQQWNQYTKDSENNNKASKKRFNKNGLSKTDSLNAQKSANANKKWTNNTVNNALLNSVGGATPHNSFTSTPYTHTKQKPYLYTTQMQKKAQQAYQKEQDDMNKYRARQERIAKAKAAAKAEEDKKQAARKKTDDQLWAEQKRLCANNVKNASRSGCSLCCVHPKTAETFSNFNPKTQKVVGGYIDSRDNECHCNFAGKELSGYDTRNINDNSCNAYCHANPNDIRGYDPAVNTVHYGELNKRGQCQCFLIDKNLDICSRNVSTKSDGACAACCYARPNNRWNAGFDPKKHRNTGGYVKFPKRRNIRYCECTRDDLPGEEEHEQALVMGKYTDPKIGTWMDEEFVQNTCDANKVNTSQAACTSCCAVNTPVPPQSGYTFDYGFLKDGYCKCHFKNNNTNIDVCSNDARLSSDSACLKCCEARPPSGFDPDRHEMDWGRVKGDTCECHWKTQQRVLDEEREYDPCEHKTESTGDCFACCEKSNYDRSSKVLANAKIEYGSCKCYFQKRMSYQDVANMIGGMSPF
jgi:hypothetical protein